MLGVPLHRLSRCVYIFRQITFDKRALIELAPVTNLPVVLKQMKVYVRVCATAMAALFIKGSPVAHAFLLLPCCHCPMLGHDRGVTYAQQVPEIIYIYFIGVNRVYK